MIFYDFFSFKVKSLGTEDRCPKNPVPAREEIFEYIVFRGHDIADLHVSEGPKNASQQQQQQQISDPAIAHVSHIFVSSKTLYIILFRY